MILPSNVKMAFQALKTSKLRSLLTMFGIIIGVFAVVLTVSLGEGLKRQVISGSNQFGNNLISVHPGKVVQRDNNGKITGYDLYAALGASSLSEQDAETIGAVKDVAAAAPLSIISGAAISDNHQNDSVLVVSTNEKFFSLIKQKVEFGDFFSAADSKKQIAVIGQKVADNLFKDDVPIGRDFSFRNHQFKVRGVFENFPSSPLTTTINFNNAIFIPESVGRGLLNGSPRVFEILAQPAKNVTESQAADAIESALKKAHGGQIDFTVLKQSDNVYIAGSLVNLITVFVAGVAAISVIVGGIGIMNTMFVNISERTKEIGIRKSVGATSWQIVGQFLVEAATLSLFGGIIGIILALLANLVLRLTTHFEPVITLPIMLVTAGISLLVGIFFGSAPAYKAARKDPITSLRHE